MNWYNRNNNLQPGDILYYYPQSVQANGFRPCKILERLDTAKHGFDGPLTYYLVECSCHVDSFIDMKTNMQLYTIEQKDKMK